MQVSTGEVTQIGETQLYTSFAPSPDARFLLVAWLERPYLLHSALRPLSQARAALGQVGGSPIKAPCPVTQCLVVT